MPSADAVQEMLDRVKKMADAVKVCKHPNFGLDNIGKFSGKREVDNLYDKMS